MSCLNSAYIFLLDLTLCFRRHTIIIDKMVSMHFSSSWHQQGIHLNGSNVNFVMLKGKNFHYHLPSIFIFGFGKINVETNLLLELIFYLCPKLNEYFLNILSSFIRNNTNSSLLILLLIKTHNSAYHVCMCVIIHILSCVQVHI